MSTPVRVRRLSDAEGQQLQRIVRRSSGKSDNSVVKWRRALVVLASAGGNDGAPRKRPQRLRVNYHKPHGTRQFFGWYSVGDDRLGGRIERKKGKVPMLRAIQAIRALRPDGNRST